MSDIPLGALNLDVGQALAHIRAVSGELRFLAQGIVEAGAGFASLAVEAETHSRALAALGPAYQLVAEQTNDVVSAEQAWHAQQALTQSGLHVSATELATLTRHAREYAIQTGTDTTSALERLTGALERGSARGLIPFGIHVERGADRVQTFHAALRQWHGEQERTTPATRTLAEEVSVLGRNFGELGGAIAGSIARALGLAPALQAVSNRIRDLIGDIQAIGAEGASQQRNEQRGQTIELVLHRLEQAQRGGMDTDVVRRAGRLFGSNRAGQITNEQLNQIATAIAANESNSLAHFNQQQLAQIVSQIEGSTTLHPERGGAQSWEQLANQAAANATPATPEIHSGNPGAGAARAARAAEREEDQADRDSKQQILEMRRQEAELIQQKSDATQAEIEAMRAEREETARAAASKINESDALERATARTRNLSDALGDAATRSAEAHGAMRASAEQAADAIVGANEAMASAISQHMAAVAKGKESFGDAMRGIAEQVVESIETQAIAHGVMDILLGIERGLSSYGFDPTAYGLLTTGAAFLAVGAGAMAVSALIGSAGGGSAAAGGGAGGYAGGGNASAGANVHGGGESRGSGNVMDSTGLVPRAASTGSTSGFGSGNVNITVNVSGVMSNEQTQDQIGRSLEGLYGRGRLPYFMQ